MLTLDQYLMGREIRFPLTEQLKENALYLIHQMNSLEEIFGEPLIMTSGYRPSQINSAVPGSSQNSTHQTCEGIDFHDPQWDLYDFLAANPSLMKSLGLYMEDKLSAKTHCHLQIRPPKSGKRIFIA